MRVHDADRKSLESTARSWRKLTTASVVIWPNQSPASPRGNVAQEWLHGPVLPSYIGLLALRQRSMLSDNTIEQEIIVVCDTKETNVDAAQADR